VFQNPVVRKDHDFETLILDLKGKTGFRPLFLNPVSKTTGFKSGSYNRRILWRKIQK
jgi:hypothetical protein